MTSLHSHGELLKNAVIDTIVPAISDLDIEEALSQSSEEGHLNSSGILPSIPQRQLLFFGTSSSFRVLWSLYLSFPTDESVTVHVVLRLTNSSEETLKEILPRLTIKVEVLAVTNQLHTHDGKVSEVMGQTSELVYSDLVKDTEDPLIVVHDSDGDDSDGNLKEVFALWKLDTFLSMPPEADLTAQLLTT
jgi:hypothetical protein